MMAVKKNQKTEEKTEKELKEESETPNEKLQKKDEVETPKTQNISPNEEEQKKDEVETPKTQNISPNEEEQKKDGTETLKTQNISGKKEEDKWMPRTSLGNKVKEGLINDINQVFDNNFIILEQEIVNRLLPTLDSDLLLVGQSKGKFGGGSRRVFKQTQKKTPEGNKPSFSCVAVVGNKNGFIGLGGGKSKDTVPSRDKALRKAKLNLIRIRRGCGSWDCGCKEPHSLPFKVKGKCGSSEILLIPAPRGKGLCVEKECAKILMMAGIKDVWSKTFGQTKTKQNLIHACFDALKKLDFIKLKPEYVETTGLIEGREK